MGIFPSYKKDCAKRNLRARADCEAVTSFPRAAHRMHEVHFLFHREEVLKRLLPYEIINPT